MPEHERIELERRGGLFTLYIGGRAQGHRDIDALGGATADTMASFALRQRPRASRALVVGVGLGEDVQRLRARGVQTEAVELRAPVAYLADSLGAGHIEIGDGRQRWQTLIEDGQRFDLVVLDACTGPGAPPTHLWNDGAPAELRTLLERDGLLLVRVIDAPHGRTCGGIL